MNCITDEAHAALAVRTVISLTFQEIIRLTYDDVTVSVMSFQRLPLSLQEILVSIVYSFNRLLTTPKNVGNLLK